MSNEKLFARRLKQIKIMNHLKPQDLALICNVSDATYYRYRSGQDLPGYDLLKRLVERFKIDSNWLFSDKIE